jgi:hypothetical protein
MKSFSQSVRWRAKVRAALLLLSGTALSAAHAQDTNYAPENQQIPPPSCLTAQVNWQELHRGPEPACDQATLQAWLSDVRHWRDERRIRTHTRGAILRGGNNYQPQGSIWYFPEAYRNDQHSKLLLMAPSYDRSGTIGFRCVMDMA